MTNTDLVSPRVSAIIPVFNNLALTKRCLRAIKGNETAVPLEIIVVDNCSSDGTRSWLQEMQAQGVLKAILNEANLGFVEACNIGAKAASGQHLLFLNNDTEPQKGWLDALVSTIESDPLIGAVGAKLVYPDGRLQEAGGIVFSDGSGWNYGRGDDPHAPMYNFVREVDYCSGACLLVRGDLFHNLQGFDSRYAPAYYEDTDLCFAIRQAGYRVLYQPASVVIHFEGATAGTDLNAGAKRFQETNRSKFVEKWRVVLETQCAPDPGIVRIASRRTSGRRILVIDPFMPAYDRASGSKRLFEMIKIMIASGHAVTFIARNGEGQERYVAELRQLGVEVYATDPERLRQEGVSTEARPIDLPRLLLESRFHVAILSFYNIAEQYLDTIRQFSPFTSIVVDTVDVHFVREQRQAELYDSPELRKKAMVTRKNELAIYARADALIAVTQQDAEQILAELPGSTIYVVPNIHEMAESSIPWREREGLLFVGNFRHLPNVDAMLFFCQEILPLVRTRLPDVPLTIAGDAPPKEISDLACAGVTVTGYVPDLGPHLRSHRVSIAPLRYGAGMKGKIGEAMANGLPVVTTSIGAEGMGLGLDQLTVVVADTPAEFAEAIIRAYENETLWERLSHNGMQHIQNSYSANVVAERLKPVLEVREQTRQQMDGGNGRVASLSSSCAAVYCVYDDDSWLSDSVESIYDACGAVYFLVSDRPWHGDPCDNRTLIDTIHSLPDPHDKIRLVHGQWRSEAEQRNAGIDLLAGEGFKYCLVIDGDEVYAPGELRSIMDLAARYPQVGCWHAHMDTYWKSFRYRVDPREPSKPAVLVRVEGARFTGYRNVSTELRATIPIEVARLHHLSYARTDDQVLRKISTFSHAHELIDGWYEKVWKRWDADHSLRNLNPLNPSDYHRAISQPFLALPPVLKRRFLDERTSREDSGDEMVSIIVLAHNQWPMTRQCLESVAKFTPERHEIIVVDNGSIDETPDRLREALLRTPNLRVISNRPNLGFAAGNNQGLAIAEGRYFVLLNNDTVVTDGWLARMLAAMKAHPEAGIVGPMSNYVSGPQLVPQVPYRHIDSMPAFAERWSREHAGQIETVIRVVGFCLLTSREVVDHIGGLDERFGSGNFEDDDFCLRAAFAGFGALIARDSFVHHRGSQTFTAAKIDWQGNMLRNWEFFKAKWGIPSNTPIEAGYHRPESLPPGAALYTPLPELEATHSRTEGGRWWKEAVAPLSVIVVGKGPETVEFWSSLRLSSASPLAITVSDQERTAGKASGNLDGMPDGWPLSASAEKPQALINRALQQGEGRPVLLLSSDIMLSAGSIDRLIGVLKSAEDIAVAGPLSNKAPRPQHLKDKYHGTGKEFRRFARICAERRAGEFEVAEYLGNFCIAIDPSAHSAVGPIREDLELHLSMWEYFARMREAGLRVVVARDTYVHHEHLDLQEGAGYDGLAAAESALREAMAAGESAMESGDLGMAEAEFQNLVEAFPDLAAGHASLGSVLLAMGEYERAIVALRKAINLAPQDSAVRNQLGVALFQEGDQEAAEKAFRQAQELAPEDPQALLNLIELYRGKERYEDATAALRDAMRIAPNHPEVLFAFGVVSLELGDAEGGQMAAIRLQAVMPEHSGLVVLRRTLAEITEARAGDLALAAICP